MAPEIFKRKYNRAVDVWSCGIIMYTFLSGMTPFFGQSDAEIYENIQEEELVFNANFEGVSSDAKDLITKMLQKDFKKRIGIEEALDHVWFSVAITRNTTKSFDSELDSDLKMRSVDPVHLENLLEFQYKSKMQEILYKYFVNQITSKKEREVSAINEENLEIVFSTKQKSKRSFIQSGTRKRAQIFQNSHFI